MNVGGNALHFLVHVPIGDEQVQPSVVIVIEKAAAEAQHISGGHRDPGDIAHLVEESFAVVVPDMIRRQLEIRDVQVEIAVVIVIAERNAHGSHGGAVGCKRHSAGDGYFGEGAVVIVVIKIRLDSVIGDEQVGPSVIVVVGGCYRKVQALGLKDFRGLRDIGESAIAVVVIEHIGCSAVDRGSATGGHSVTDGAGALAGGVEVRIAAYVEIQLAVAIVIKKSGAGVEHCTEIRAADTGLIGHVGECAIAVVVIKNILPVLCHVQIGEAVVVIVAP